MMINRRTILSAAALPLLALPIAGIGSPAEALELKPYDDAAAQALIKAGKPVVLHVYAPWCLQCRVQASYLSGTPGDAALDKVAFFRVGYDNQKDVVAALNAPRSTLIAYKGGKEVARMSWGTSQDDVARVLKTVS